MSYQVLARKYRPQRFDEVIGQEHVTRTLKNALSQQRIAHGYIFSGHRGIGKTTVARILAMALNCRAGDAPRPEPCGQCDSCIEIREGRAVDVIEIDAATNRGIDEIRELREAARYRPARDRYKIYILDEAHQITDAAFNALLKTLEEPPPHVVFMMATTQPEDIPQTIRSRCQHFSFHAVRFSRIVEQLRQIAALENLQVAEDALALVAEAGDGSLRDALSILDQAVGAAAGEITAASIRELVGAVSGETLELLLRAVAADNSQELLRRLDSLCSEGQSPVHLARQLVRFLRNALMAKVAGHESDLLQVSADERARVAAIAALFTEEDLTRFLQIMLRAHNDICYRPDPRFHLELVLVKLVHAGRLLPIEEILSGAASASPSSRAGAPNPERAHPDRNQTSAVTPPRAAARPQSPAESASPFERDRARKAPNLQSSAPEVQSVRAASHESSAATGLAEPCLESLKQSILQALAGGHRTLASELESGEWQVNGNELLIRCAAAASFLEVGFTPDARRVATAAAAAWPTPLKIRLEGNSATAARAVNGANPHASQPAEPAQSSPAAGRQRAADDPIVRRVQEKFGAQIRTVIDYREKRR